MQPVAIIGDVHGCLEEFVELVGILKEKHGVQRIVCLGDFLDKGPYPLECLRFARTNGFETVAANHEERHARWWRKERARKETGKPNNMRPWHDSTNRAVNEKLTLEEVEWIETRPAWIEVVPGWVAVHGGFNPELPLAKQDPKKVIRLRYVNESGDHVPVEYDDQGSAEQPAGTAHWTLRWKGPESVVYGHEAFSLSHPNVTSLRRINKLYNLDGRLEHIEAVSGSEVSTWGIDTGCVHGGRLSALIVPTKELVQVKARQVYLYHPRLNK